MIKIKNQNNNHFNIGDKVTYIPNSNKNVFEYGIIKGSLIPKYYHVVYKCNDDWDNYMDYTGLLTYYKSLYKGWINPNKIKIKLNLNNIKKLADNEN